MARADKPPDITPGDLALVLTILRKHVPDRMVMAFGSRVTGTPKPFSDLDLVVMGDEPTPSGVLSNLHDEFDESALPFKVDLVDWATTDEPFRKIIANTAIKIFPEMGHDQAQRRRPDQQ